ncbi:hypothetical protein GQ43DRAFT_38935 [Delitschia confertaspora ATCC 74209]|uniref:Zn(2)-C6 fungal-type domain-containing protein n=1 Tax=Delitschia confertaspora ATCC 74209 TaxID=1513339 RepID=A0A9P4MVQ1_9PLEO|nr:hypothetical protein GQ43DRAFT_38935 [Delitschia confertaspora ATCC 74209]
MPRPKKPGAPEPKKRSRTGCWPCKARKVKCGEQKPRCANCERQGETCDYSIRLNWEGRTKKSMNNSSSGKSNTTGSPRDSIFTFSANSQSPISLPTTSPVSVLPPQLSHYARSHSAATAPLSGDAIGRNPDQIMPLPPQMQSTLHTRAPSDYNCFLPQTSTSYMQGEVHMPTSVPYDKCLQDTHTHYRSLDPPSASINNFNDLFFVSSASYDTTTVTQTPLSPPSMLPSMRGYSPQYSGPSRTMDSIGEHYKRQKRSHSSSKTEKKTDASSASDTVSPPSYSPFTAAPLTPSSSAGSEDRTIRPTPRITNTTFHASDPRRLSVQSLLIRPSGDSQRGFHPEALYNGRQYPMEDTSYITHGYDLGHPDLDMPKNDDIHAIAIISPAIEHMELSDYEGKDLGQTACSKDIAFAKGGYYAKPVPIRIAKSLQLPSILLKNPMNLLYFHHFLNHTARILVPHDCEQNPFRQILPEMAIHDENIMNILLAFSASHRARLLSHPEPATRIAHWGQTIFPSLRQSLTSPNAYESNTTLMTAIMLASLEIISPNTFEVSISWQRHLTIARQMIISRGGPKSVKRDDQVAWFMSRWFAYLDVLGSLSGGKNGRPLGSEYWSSDNLSADEDFQIDCLLGFTGRCIGILARIAELAKQCEHQRLDDSGNVREDWRPDEDVVAQAEQIRRALEEGLSDGIVYKACNHRSSSDSTASWDAVEIYATNSMFHWAGLIHLYRRCLGHQSHSPLVQNAVREIVGLLYKVRKGSTAEACLLFPMFTAGCDALDREKRERVLERMRGVEEFGMGQVGRARRLMERVWESGRVWEGLVCGEFFG